MRTSIIAALVAGWLMFFGMDARAHPGTDISAEARTRSDVCNTGFVWREARGSDHVCVTPESRQQVAGENRTAESRRDGNGAYGPASCHSGFVWREAFAGDTVCVIPERRAAVREENRLAPTRLMPSSPLRAMRPQSHMVVVQPAQENQNRSAGGLQAGRQAIELNPQPLPPGPPDRSAWNIHGSATELNPQPLPPEPPPGDAARQIPGKTFEPMPHNLPPPPDHADANIGGIGRHFLPKPSQPLPVLGNPGGKIGEKYAALGGRGGPLGQPIGNEADAPHGGRLHYFSKGVVFWHPQIGEAFAVWGAIGVKLFDLGGVEFGYPITDETVTPDGRGRFNHFRALQSPGAPEASIYWTPATGAHEVHGLIRDAWAKAGWERGPLGYPTSDGFQDGVFRRSNFERGYILWSPSTGIRVVEAGAAIDSQAQPNTFRALLVNGMEVAVKGRPIAGDPMFLSENNVCGQWNAHLDELNGWVQGHAVALINEQIHARVSRDIGVRTSGTHVNFSRACSFRAEVLQACQNHIDMHLLLPGNAFQVYLMTPFTAHHGIGGDTDPKFVLRADVHVTTSIRTPATRDGALELAPAGIRLSNIKLEAANATAALAKSAVEIGSQFFMGRNIVDLLSQDRMFRLDGISEPIVRLAPALRSLPSGYHINACLRDADVFRLDGTDVVDREPIIH